MKNSCPPASPQMTASWPVADSDTEQFTGQSSRTVLVSLMVPFMMVILNLTMFGLALPTLRDTFHLSAEVTAWLVTVYMLPFMITMPLYGRLGDELGKRRLFLAGIGIFLGGTLLSAVAGTLPLLLLGRAVQGVGAACVVPLSMAIISQVFPTQERGKALGTWNSVGPMTAIAAPFMAGLLIDHIGWRMIFVPILVAGLAAVWVVRGHVPTRRSRQPQATILRTFDWGGVALLGAAVTTLTFYLSSETITGVAALQDWRLLLATGLFFGGFFVWEQRQRIPYITLKIFADKTFSRASFSAATRMFVMSGNSFLVPLYLTDVHQLSAAATGVLLTLHAAALLMTMRVGGQLADRWNSRRPVLIGFFWQIVMMSFFAMLPGSAALWIVAAGLVMHGLGAGLSLAPLHRASLGQIEPAQAGMAAGLYSLIRFAGTVLGPIMTGVALQYGLNQGLLPIAAYQMAYWLIAGVALLGVFSVWGLKG